MTDARHKGGETRSPVAVMARWILGHRRLLAFLFAVVTVLLAANVTRLRVDAGFEKLIPVEHPYMRVLAQYRHTFGGANRVLIALSARDGNIFTPRFFERLKAVTDAVFFIDGIDRTRVQSIFTPNARYIETIENGFSGGNIVPATFAPTPEALARVRANVLKSAEVGRLVANDLGAAMVRAELLDVDPVSGRRPDLFAVARALEQVRDRFAGDGIDIQIIGFPTAINDIAEGTRGVLAFFGVAFALTVALLVLYTGSIRLAALPLAVALLPVVWMLGLLPLLGYGIDPMSVLVPFLIFSIGVSHAVQMTRAWQIACRGGATAESAATAAFVKLFAPGALALIANALGFLVIMFIHIDIVRELGITASLGVALMVVTNKVLLPILLSWMPASAGRLGKPLGAAPPVEWVHARLASFARRRRALWVLALSLALLGGAAWKARDLQVGDLGAGLPELRADARYNRDVAEIVRRFSIGVDVFSVIVQTRGHEAACMDYGVMSAIERFGWAMAAVPGVHSVIALPGIAREVNQAINEGNPKWRALPRDPHALAQAISPVDTGSGLINADCSVFQVLVFTADHEGPTLKRVVGAARQAAREFGRPDVDFLLASGNAGIMAATNEAVDAAEGQMLSALFGAIGLLCLVVFRSWRATLCVVLPLGLVSVLCNALMASLGIGLKLSTLPVVALGVGVGVDYGIYLYGAMRERLDAGRPLRDAVAYALHSRGGAIVFTALTMSAGVATWTFSALKFQADMGLLLAFMFLVNMLGAMMLLPALAAWLLPDPKPGGQTIWSNSSTGVQDGNRGSSSIVR